MQLPHRISGRLVKRVALSHGKFHYFDRALTTSIATGKFSSTTTSRRLSRSHLHKAEFRARLQAVHHRERRPLLPAIQSNGSSSEDAPLERRKGDRAGISGSIQLMINCYAGYMEESCDPVDEDHCHVILISISETSAMRRDYKNSQ